MGHSSSRCCTFTDLDELLNKVVVQYLAVRSLSLEFVAFQRTN